MKHDKIFGEFVFCDALVLQMADELRQRELRVVARNDKSTAPFSQPIVGDGDQRNGDYAPVLEQ